MVASIGNLAITLGDVQAEYRLEVFLQGKIPAATPDADTLARVRDRLIAQTLLAEEEPGQAPKSPEPAGATPQIMDEVRKRFSSPDAYQAALNSLGMDEPQIVARVAGQENLLRAIEQRFRPSAWPERTEVETYYRETFVPEFFSRSSTPPPALNEIEGKITEILVEKKINLLLESWVEEMKSNRRVRVHEF